MGFFSWNTADTNESIANREAPHPNAGRTSYLLQPNGAPPIQEDDYVGYGVENDEDNYDHGSTAEIPRIVDTK